MTNRLAEETSPYLLQHKDNPVDWYPWGEQALERARADDKPIFLSIGYAACHWCHVMEHESFEDPDTAQMLNDNFVSIKVDREERPDLDAIYMDAVQAMTGHGGWPMSVFLTPEGIPFYGGTYFPRDRRGGMPAFREVLAAILDAWHHRRDDVSEQGGRLLEAIDTAPRLSAADIPDDTLDTAVQAIGQLWDDANGGLGGAPKFPQPMVLEFMLRMYARTGDRSLLDRVEHSLRRMARGGLYDQIGGGFHRYCVDAHWGVPHFEKMLYDNAQLVPVYLHAYQITGAPEYSRVVVDTLDYLIREMRQPEGGLGSSQDADSEGVEGKFFVWTPDELVDVLGADLGARAGRYYGVTSEGNFESGTTVLHIADPDALGDDELPEVESRLFEARNDRIPPATDDKVLASWNGLALAAFAEAGRVLDREDFVETAGDIAGHIESSMTDGDRLLHTWRVGTASVPGFADDYASVALGLLELYAATGDETAFTRARSLVEVLITHFSDPNGGFFTTADDAESLVLRPKEVMDNAVPSANSLAADACSRLALLTGEAGYEETALGSLSVVSKALGPQAQAFGRALSTLAFIDADVSEIAIVGPDRGPLVREVDTTYRPFVVLAQSAGNSSVVPLMQDRGLVDKETTAYVCRNFVCKAPVTTPAALAAELG